MPTNLCHYNKLMLCAHNVYRQYVGKYVHTCVCTYMHVYVFIYVCMYPCMCVINVTWNRSDLPDMYAEGECQRVRG